MFTDSHCHLASSQFKAEEIPNIVERAKDAGIHRMITLSTSHDDVLDNLQLAEQYPEIYFCAGIHPCDVTNAPDDAVDQITEHIQHSKLCAIGETGLDYYHPAPEGWTEDDYHQRQREFLTQHFELAAQYGFNLAMHTRDRTGEASLQDALEIYQKYSDRVKAVFHCFPGTIEQANRVFDLGGLISFTGNVTFKNAAQIRETARAVPLDRIMLETDAPYLAPTPHRGTRNEPSRVKEIAYAIATEQQLSPQELSTATEANVQSFFRFN